ncbi:MAG: hypothetical protein ACREFD_15200 [Stellaceae bacterium]
MALSRDIAAAEMNRDTEAPGMIVTRKATLVGRPIFSAKVGQHIIIAGKMIVAEIMEMPMRNDHICRLMMIGIFHELPQRHQPVVSFIDRSLAKTDREEILPPPRPLGIVLAMLDFSERTVGIADPGRRGERQGRVCAMGLCAAAIGPPATGKSNIRMNPPRLRHVKKPQFRSPAVK